MASNEIEWDCCTLDNEYHDLRLSFTINNFLDYNCKPGQPLDSSQMECAQRCGAKWKLSVYPHGDSVGEKSSVAVYLKLMDTPSHYEIISATYEIYILGNNDAQFFLRKPNGDQVEDLRRGRCCSKRRSEILNDKDRFLPNGHLTIRCEGKAFVNKSHQIVTIKNFPRTIAANPSSSILKKVYQEEICCDVVLRTGSSEFKCHKAILAATCNYFKAMFEHDMKENRENVVDLSKDLKEDELRAMLDYVYLEKREMKNLSQASVQNLLRVSDMYEMYGLQEVCETALIGQVNRENAAELLTFSDQLGANRLKKAAACVIIYNSD